MRNIVAVFRLSFGEIF